MSDKPKRSWQSRLIMPMVIGCFVAAFVLRYTISPGLLPFSIAVFGAIIFFLLPSSILLITKVIRQGWFIRIFSGLGLASFMLTFYSMLVLGNSTLVSTFGAMGWACISAALVYKAWQCSGADRRLYLGYTAVGAALLVMLAGSTISSTFSLEPSFVVIVIAALLFLFLLSAGLKTIQQSLLEIYQQRRHKEWQIAAGEDGSLPTEQLKADTVKEQG